MTDRTQAPGTPRIPIEPVQKTGGETKAAPKTVTFDPAPPAETSGGMASQGGEGGGAAAPKDSERQGGMIGEG